MWVHRLRDVTHLRSKALWLRYFFGQSRSRRKPLAAGADVARNFALPTHHTEEGELSMHSATLARKTARGALVALGLLLLPARPTFAQG